MITLAEARARVVRRLNDASQTFWANDEIDGYLVMAYQTLTRTTRAVWDQLYLENLPRGFSYTNTFEQALASFDYGAANFTYEDERRLIDPERLANGPANHTSPFEIEHLESAGANTASAPTMQVPRDLTEMDRPTYDDMAIPTITQSDAGSRDSRYEYTQGPVYALITKGEGLRTVRKVRVPSMMADTVDVDGSWGIVRDLSDVTGSTVVGSWGIPRQVPTMHPMGPEHFGTPRRVFLDRMNVRIEHWRDGQAVAVSADVFELPDRAVAYLVDYAMSECYRREGPAQDARMAAHYESRWQRGVSRLLRRVQAMQRNRTGVMGVGAGVPVRRGPPLPSLPWPYGARLGTR